MLALASLRPDADSWWRLCLVEREEEEKVVQHMAFFLFREEENPQVVVTLSEAILHLTESLFLPPISEIRPCQRGGGKQRLESFESKHRQTGNN